MRRRKYSIHLKRFKSAKNVEPPRLIGLLGFLNIKRMSDPQQSFHLAAFLGNDLWEKDLKAELRSRWWLVYSKVLIFKKVVKWIFPVPQISTY